MGGYLGKSSARETANQSYNPEAGGAELSPSGSSGAGRNSPVTERNVCSRLGVLKSVRRTVNDLYQDGKHAFSFSPADSRNYDHSVDLTEEQSTVDVNRRNSDGETPLTSLIRKNDVEGIQELLLSPGIDVNYEEKQLYCGYRWDFYPPLILAINEENTEMVKLLLQAGASVNCCDSQGFSALYHASKLGNKEIVALLLSHSPNLMVPPAIDSCTITDPLHIACCHGNIDVAELLIKAGCQVNPTDGMDNKQTPLDHALDSNNEALCLLLLQNGARITQTLFYKACQYGCVKIVQYMINSGIDAKAVNEHRETALMYALNPGYINRLRRKVSYVAEAADARKMTLEVLQQNVNILHLLCRNGCDLDVRDQSGMSAVYRSWHLQILPAVVVLLKHGASFEIDSAHLHVELVNDEVYNDMKTLFLTFIASQIPSHVVQKRKKQKHIFETHSMQPVTSLQHICRLVIRNRLKSCRSVTNSIIINIEKLTLPPRLKDYLCYSEIDEMSESYCDKLFRLSWSPNS